MQIKSRKVATGKLARFGFHLYYIVQIKSRHLAISNFASFDFRYVYIAQIISRHFANSNFASFDFRYLYIVQIKSRKIATGKLASFDFHYICNILCIVGINKSSKIYILPYYEHRIFLLDPVYFFSEKTDTVEFPDRFFDTKLSIR